MSRSVAEADVHMDVESHVIERLGIDIGGRMHTCRSRNDQVHDRWWVGVCIAATCTYLMVAIYVAVVVVVVVVVVVLHSWCSCVVAGRSCWAPSS